MSPTKPLSTTLTACRCCGSADLPEVLDLGISPLANRLLDTPQPTEPEPMVPLKVVCCADCGLVQLTETVDPEVLFSHYVYFSSVSDALLAHSEDHVATLVEQGFVGPGKVVVELASNDGYLLQYAQQAGAEVLGVEPAANIAQVARDRGIPTRTAFFHREEGERMAAEGIEADVVLGNNVLAHVPDPVSFLAGARALLREGGRVEIEAPYLTDLVDHLEFDTIYHEHLCYFSVTAVKALCARADLTLCDVVRLPIHGGSIRFTAVPTGAPLPQAGMARVDALLAEEHARQLDRPAGLQAFGAQVHDLGRAVRQLVDEAHAKGESVAAYGASAKGTTLLTHWGIGDKLRFVADRSPAKQGRFTPGTHLPIVPPDALTEQGATVALLLTWNFADEIAHQQADWMARGGRFLVPLPQPHFLSSAP